MGGADGNAEVGGAKGKGGDIDEDPAHGDALDPAGLQPGAQGHGLVMVRASENSESATITRFAAVMSVSFKTWSDARRRTCTGEPFATPKAWRM